MCTFHSARLLARGEVATWQRLMKRGRLLKEVNEVLPVAAKVIEWVKQHTELCDQDLNSKQVGQEGLRHVQGKITIIDLCEVHLPLSMKLHSNVSTQSVL